MKIDYEPKLDFDDVLLVPKRSSLESRKKVDITRYFEFKHSENDWEGIPIIASNMSTVGTLSMAKALSKNNMMTCLHKFIGDDVLYNEYEDWINFIPTFGVEFDRLKNVLNYNFTITTVCLDVANGYQESFVDFVKKVRDLAPGLTIIAGNVVTAGMTEALVMAGADIVKVGIGSGSACTTRIKTGVGYPQLSAIMECADAAHGLGAQIISDGGCRTPGDVVKAFAAGADFVMLGGMLAGHDECEGQVIVDDRDMPVMEFYGMSSAMAQETFGDGVSNYATSEGREILVPYRGPVQFTLDDIMGGLRSACTYVGAHRLKELTKRATFVRISHPQNLYNRSYE